MSVYANALLIVPSSLRVQSKYTNNFLKKPTIRDNFFETTNSAVGQAVLAPYAKEGIPEAPFRLTHGISHGLAITGATRIAILRGSFVFLRVGEFNTRRACWATLVIFPLILEIVRNILFWVIRATPHANLDYRPQLGQRWKIELARILR